MKLTYVLPVVACLFSAITVVNSQTTTLMPGADCEKVFQRHPGFVCHAGTYCFKFPYSESPAICRPVCDYCYSTRPGASSDEPAHKGYCDLGYASYLDGWTPESAHACNICDKGWYSEDSNNDGYGSYKEGTTPYPGNVGCLKCPPGKTTDGRGLGKKVSDCKFLGELAADWEEVLIGLKNADGAEYAFESAVEMIKQGQQNLLSAGMAATAHAEKAKSNTQEIETLNEHLANLGAQLTKLSEDASKISENYDGTTGRLTCLTLQDCRDAEYVTHRKEMESEGYEPSLACIKETEGADQKGVCLEKPHLQGNPLPHCLGSECPYSCVMAEASRQDITVEEFMESEPDEFGVDICSCFTACNTSNCVTDTDKDQVSHLWRDRCHTKDPFFVPRSNSTLPTGGNNLKCGLGQYVKYKNVPNMEVCTDCPRGRFAKAKTSRNRECKRCPRGWVQPQTKQGRCTRCPTGTKANKERTACV